MIRCMAVNINVLYGDKNDDALHGQSGADIFMLGNSSVQDTMADFSTAEDSIRITLNIDNTTHFYLPKLAKQND